MMVFRNPEEKVLWVHEYCNVKGCVQGRESLHLLKSESELEVYEIRTPQPEGSRPGKVGVGCCDRVN